MAEGEENSELQVEIVSIEPRKMAKIEKPMSKLIAEAVVELAKENPDYLAGALAASPDGREGFRKRLTDLIEELDGENKTFLEAARDAL